MVAFLPTVYVRLPTPLNVATFNGLSVDATVADLDLPLAWSSLEDCAVVSNTSGRLAPTQLLSTLVNANAPFHPIQLDLQPRLRGGKGGFGSQLRAAGGRMSSKKGKDENNDSCRDLSGRRLSTIKEAKKMAEYVESKEKSQKTTLESQKAKLAALEKQLGIQTSSSTVAGLGAASSSSATDAGPSQTLTASASTPSASAADVDVTKIAQKRHRFEDNGYFETSREINDGVRSAVTAGLLKKRKKAKVEPANKVSEPTTASAASSTVAASA